MNIYFKITAGTTNIIEVITKPAPLEGFNDKDTSLVNGKPFLVEAAVTMPIFDEAIEVREGPVDNYDGTNATRVYTVRAKTQTELDAEALAKDNRALRVATKDAVIVLTALIDAILAKGLLVPTDVEPIARQSYLDLKVIADRVKA